MGIWSEMKKVRFVAFQVFVWLMIPWIVASGQTNRADSSSLEKVGSQFSFAICSDPQVAHKDNLSFVSQQARKTQIMACQEINSMSPMPAFTVFLGDLVNVFDEQSVENFKECISDLKSVPVIVHGNHDTLPPYTEFKKLTTEYSGVEDAWYSFNAGKWHFIVLPCNLDGHTPEQTQCETAMLKWLESDITANRTKPTMVFNHLHMLPQGLSQLEWYTFPLKLRLKLMDMMTKYGNVKYYFNGHVHNGIKASIKMAWEYKGITFITAPTIIQSRPFGEQEEYGGFERGPKDGGYYMIVDVNGTDVILKGRLAGEEKEFVYPQKFRVFEESIEPRWFSRVSDMKASEILVNGSFKDDLNGWFKAYRYMADQEPAYVYKVTDKSPDSNSNSVYIYTREKPPALWGSDERSEVYQIVSMPKADSAVLKASYRLDKAPVNGGGYIRLTAFRNEEYKFLMMFKWGQEYEYPANYLPRCLGYELFGRQQSWAFLQDEGKVKRGMYFDISCEPGKWHQLVVNIASLYDSAMGIDGAFNKLGITKFYIGAGTWCNKDAGSNSDAYFTGFSLSGGAATGDTAVDGQPFVISPKIFKTQFGQMIVDQKIKRLQQKK